MSNSDDIPLLLFIWISCAHMVFRLAWESGRCKFYLLLSTLEVLDSEPTHSYAGWVCRGVPGAPLQYKGVPVDQW